MASAPQLARLALLAAGSVDIVLSLGPKHDWDVAAGALLVSEAGGRITTEKGAAMIFRQARPRQNGLVAAGTARHSAVDQFMERHEPPSPRRTTHPFGVRVSFQM